MPLKETAKRMPALAFWLGFMLWVLASIFISGIDALTFLKSWTLNLDYAVVGILAINLLTTRRRLMGLIDLILVEAVLIALYGIYGYVTHQHGQVDPTTGAFRITSIFNLATAFALHLSFVIPLAIFRAYTSHGARRFGMVLATLVLALAVVLTETRTALIAIPLSIIVQVVFIPSRRIKQIVFSGGFVVGLLLVILAVAGNSSIFGRFLNPDLTTLNG